MQIVAVRVSFQISGLNRCVLISNRAYKCPCLLATELISGYVARRLQLPRLPRLLIPTTPLPPPPPLALLRQFPPAVVDPISSRRSVTVVTLAREYRAFFPHGRSICSSLAGSAFQARKRTARKAGYTRSSAIDIRAKRGAASPQRHSKVPIF